MGLQHHHDLRYAPDNGPRLHVFLWLMTSLTGASKGTIGTHTLVNPETGEIIETWHDNQIAKVSAIGGVT